MAKADFEHALQMVLQHEGEFSFHKDDPGGATMKGITLKTFSAWLGQAVDVARLRAITDAEISAIYRQFFWNAVQADNLPPGLDYVMFDCAVHSGPARAIRLLQEVLGVKVDGKIGAQTRAAIEGFAPEKLITLVVQKRRDFVRGLKVYPVFARGWMQRINDVERGALNLHQQAVFITEDLPKKEPATKEKELPVQTGGAGENATLPRFITQTTPRVSTPRPKVPITQSGVAVAEKEKKVAPPVVNMPSLSSVFNNLLPNQNKEKHFMDLTKSIFTSRTLWSNGIGLLALGLSQIGFHTEGFDANVVTDQLFTAIAGISFVASSFFRVVASKKIG